MELAISSRVDKGLTKGPTLAPRVRPRVKAVEEPKKKPKVEEPAPVEEEEASNDPEEEQDKVEPVKQVGNIIIVPEIITPQQVEKQTVDECPIVIKDLIKSKFEKGQLSKTEVARRQLKAEKRKAIVKDEEGLQTPKVLSDQEELLTPRGPQLRLVNGEMVIDENSLLLAAEKEKVDFQRIEEGAARYVSSASFRLRPKTARVKWTPEMTELFYDGLSYFGTDFGLISLLFPGFSRNVIKLKFNHEERTNSTKVNEALLHRKVPNQELKMQMKQNLSSNLEKAEESAQAENEKASHSKRSKQKNLDDKENVQQEEDAPTIEAVAKETPTVVEKVFQETAQKSFEDAIGSVQSLSVSFSKVSQGPKIAPRVSNRPSRKQKEPTTGE